MATKTRKTRFVPQAILTTASIVSVIPAVALVDCGGEVAQSSQPDAGSYGVGTVAAVFDAGKEDSGQFTVGVGFGVSAAYDAGTNEDSAQFTVGIGFGVAAVFDAATDAPSGDASVLGVAAIFDASGSDGSDDAGEG